MEKEQGDVLTKLSDIRRAIDTISWNINYEPEVHFEVSKDIIKDMFKLNDLEVDSKVRDSINEAARTIVKSSQFKWWYHSLQEVCGKIRKIEDEIFLEHLQIEDEIHNSYRKKLIIGPLLAGFFVGGWCMLSNRRGN